VNAARYIDGRADGAIICRCRRETSPHRRRNPASARPPLRGLRARPRRPVRGDVPRPLGGLRPAVR